MSRPFLSFLEMEVAGGLFLLVCTAAALILANSPWSAAFAKLWETPIALTVGDATISHSLVHWINDGLMTVFFFVVGLEIKREMVAGELTNARAAALPAMAALGGMILPASVYLLVLGEHPGREGWGIPMATDIAFAVGFLSLLGRRAPHGLKIFLLSLAIIDDIGAVIVIATFYSSNISPIALAFGGVGCGIIWILNRLGVRQVPVYILFGVIIWCAFLFSGVHPTIAGVLLGLMTPASAWVGDETFREVMGNVKDKLFGSSQPPEEASRAAQVSILAGAVKETVSPLERLETVLHPWVAFFIMPVFALANAGVPLVGEAAASPVSVAVAVALIFGKPIGILSFSWIAVKFIGARLPSGVNWAAVLGAGCLAGIGFTMSIFIAGLALSEHLLVVGKVGTLIGSFVSSLLGLGILFLKLPAHKQRRHFE